MADHHIRPAEAGDFAAILALARGVAEEGDAFPWTPAVSDEELSFYWLPNPQLRLETFVAEGSGRGREIAGACVLHPAAGGRASHVANGAFAVAPPARGRGLGKRLCMHALDEARRQGYTSMRFNMVVATNIAAVRVCMSCGFKSMCTLPRVFQHPVRGLVDAHVMLCDLEGKEVQAGPPTPVGTASTAATSTSAATATAAAAAPGLRYQRLDLGGWGGSAGPAGVPSAAAGAGGTMLLAGGEQVRLEPRFGGWRATPAGATFSAQPGLPEGLNLDPTTGVISGTVPRGRCDVPAFRVSAAFSADFALPHAGPAQWVGGGRRSALGLLSGSGDGSDAPTPSRASLASQDAPMAINEDFAAKLENVVDLRDLMPEPARTRAYGDWMIWMVHRVWLDDPSLVVLDFTNMDMPLGHVEKRIAPKLMAAIETNTHLQVLSLSNSNMQRVQGVELATSLMKNRTLVELNLESNWLDSQAVRELAVAIRANPECRLETLRVSHQKQMGQFFGRPTEEAVGQMMKANKTILKLGFECDDAHWRDCIDRALLTNNDLYRRRQLGPGPEELPSAEERTLGHLLLQAPPAFPAAELFPADSAAHATFRIYLEQNLKLPTTSQLQMCAKNNQFPLAYAVVAPTIKECRSRLLDSTLGKGVVVTDAFGLKAEGVLRSWSEANEQWTVDVWGADGGRYLFKSAKDPGFAVSQSWGKWLSTSSRSAGRAGA